MDSNKNIFTYNLKSEFSLPLTLDCGQSFRWKEDEEGKWRGIIGKSPVALYEKENVLYIEGDIERERILNYLDLNRDYEELKNSYRKYKPLNDAINYCGGIRILRQDFFETLITFILSQNNNIPRIKSLVEALCRKFGEKIGDDLYAFPDCNTLASSSIEEIGEIKCGFRAKYIFDAACKIKDGTVNPEKIKDMTLEEAEDYLCLIKGVGKKVADCTLLFGLGRFDAFPVDVWIKRALHSFFPEGIPQDIAETAGIAQQFLFHYIRTSPDTEEIRKEERRLKKEKKEEKARKKKEKEEALK